MKSEGEEEQAGNYQHSQESKSTDWQLLKTVSSYWPWPWMSEHPTEARMLHRGDTQTHIQACACACTHTHTHTHTPLVQEWRNWTRNQGKVESVQPGCCLTPARWASRQAVTCVSYKMATLVVLLSTSSEKLFGGPTPREIYIKGNSWRCIKPSHVDKQYCHPTNNTA